MTAATCLLALATLLLALPFAAATPTGKTVNDVLVNNNLTLLQAALQAAGLDVSTLTNGTLFAPTDAAFESLLVAVNMTSDELLAQVSDCGSPWSHHQWSSIHHTPILYIPGAVHSHHTVCEPACHCYDARSHTCAT